MSEQKQTFNYERVINEPIKIQQITKTFYLKKPFELRRGAAMAIIVIVLFVVFRGLINFINSLMPGIMYAIYIYVPYLITENLFKLKFDHKKPTVFLSDLFNYYVGIYLSKTKYCNDEIVSLDNKIVFEKVRG